LPPDRFGAESASLPPACCHLSYNQFFCPGIIGGIANQPFILPNRHNSSYTCSFFMKKSANISLSSSFTTKALNDRIHNSRTSWAVVKTLLNRSWSLMMPGSAGKLELLGYLLGMGILYLFITCSILLICFSQT